MQAELSPFMIKENNIFFPIISKNVDVHFMFNLLQKHSQLLFFFTRSESTNPWKIMLKLFVLYVALASRSSSMYNVHVRVFYPSKCNNSNREYANSLLNSGTTAQI